MRLLLAISILISTLVGINGSSCSYSVPISCKTVTSFKFKITNDLKESYQLFWIDFNGKLVFYNNLSIGKSVTMNSWLNHYWILTSASGKIRSFTASEDPFKKSGVSVNISNIPIY